jgi:hypothetical protein
LIPRGLVKAKAIFYVKTDVEGRRLRKQTGLDTPVVLAVNDECHRLDYVVDISDVSNVNYITQIQFMVVLKNSMVPHPAVRYNIVKY